MTPPRPPSGAVVMAPLRGEVARWAHTDRTPYLEVTLHDGNDDRPPSVTVCTAPGRFPLEGVTEPTELRHAAWLLLAAARWQERERRRLGYPGHDPEPDPQMTVFDYPEASP